LILNVDAAVAARRQPVAGVVAHSAVHDAEPGGAVEPNGHAEHDGDPGTFANESAGHDVQKLEPGVLENVPSGHGAHGSEPPGPNVPGEHVASVVVVTPIHDVEPTGAVVPGGHARHSDEPGVSANVSIGHGVHKLEAGVPVNVPGEHGVHGSMPPGPALPGEQDAPVHDVDPTGAVVPTGQTVHRNAPLVLEKVSIGHGMHALEPGVSAKVPAGQFVHGSMPPGPDVPGPHVASVVVVTVVHDTDPGRDVVPTGHASQTTVPAVAAKVSAGHGVHTLDPGMLAKVPGRHAVHGSMPPGPKLPSEQIWAAAGHAAITPRKIERRIARMTTRRTRSVPRESRRKHGR